MAIVRTVFSPRCCATSRTRRLPLLSVSSADKIEGSWPVKVTSTTAPITWLMRPVAPTTLTAVWPDPALGAGALLAAFGAAAFAGAAAFGAAAFGAAVFLGAVAMCFFLAFDVVTALVRQRLFCCYSASAPAIISMSSVVIAAWRVRLY